MKVVNMSDAPSIVEQYVMELRDVAIQHDRMRFRRNLERIGEMQAYEISKWLGYSQKFVQTPLGVATANTPDDSIVLATVFRAGLPLHQGFLNVFDHAENAFVSAYRYYKDDGCQEVGVHVEYIASPNLDGKTLVLVDPMLATGESLVLALEALMEKGVPRRVIISCVVACEAGVEHLRKALGDRNDVCLLCAVVDKELNERSYIVPGLGDAGDLAFGGKL